MPQAREVKYEETENGCWVVTSHKASSKGYPAKSGGPNKSPVRLHRFMWEQSHGSIPDGMFVLHRCDNKLCVNPGHLYLGTHRDNMNDVIARNRAKPKPVKPVKQPVKKLTEEQVAYILEHREINSTDMAKLMGVSLSQVSLIRNGKRRPVAGFDYQKVKAPRGPRPKNLRDSLIARIDRKIKRLTAELAEATALRTFLSEQESSPSLTLEGQDSQS